MFANRQPNQMFVNRQPCVLLMLVELPSSDDGEPLGHGLSSNLGEIFDACGTELTDELMKLDNKQCCTKNCAVMIKEAKTDEHDALLEKMNKMSHADQNAFLFNLLAQSHVKERVDSNRFKYSLFSMPCCRKRDFASC